MEFIPVTHTKFLFTLVIAGITLVLVTHGLPSQSPGNKPIRLSNNGTAICPNGWILAAASNNDSTQESRKLCVRVHEQLLSWERARLECRRNKGFLIKLDTTLTLNKVGLTDYLKTRGLDLVWTGMHHRYGTLVWDELQPHMVKAYYGQTEKDGWSKRGWKFDSQSLKLNTDTCGVFQLEDKDSSEAMEDQTKNRAKRAPAKPAGNTGSQRLAAGPTNVGNVDVSPSRSPIEDKGFFTRRGIQGGVSDIAGDTSNTGFSRGRFKPRTFSQSGQYSRMTTVSTTTITDQPNIEDSDDYHLDMRISSSNPNATSTTTSTTNGNITTTWKYSSQKSVMGTSLPMFTKPETTSSPQLSTGHDDLLNHFLQTSLDAASASDITGSVDAGSNIVSILEAAPTPGTDTNDPTQISQGLDDDANTTDIHFNNMDTNDELLVNNRNTTDIHFNNMDTNDELLVNNRNTTDIHFNNMDTNDELLVNNRNTTKSSITDQLNKRLTSSVGDMVISTERPTRFKNMLDNDYNSTDSQFNNVDTNDELLLNSRSTTKSSISGEFNKRQMGSVGRMASSTVIPIRHRDVLDNDASSTDSQFNNLDTNDELLLNSTKSSIKDQINTRLISSIRPVVVSTEIPTRSKDMLDDDANSTDSQFNNVDTNDELLVNSHNTTKSSKLGQLSKHLAGSVGGIVVSTEIPTQTTDMLDNDANPTDILLSNMDTNDELLTNSRSTTVSPKSDRSTNRLKGSGKGIAISTIIPRRAKDTLDDDVNATQSRNITKFSIPDLLNKLLTGSVGRMVPPVVLLQNTTSNILNLTSPITTTLPTTTKYLPANLNSTSSHEHVLNAASTSRSLATITNNSPGTTSSYSVKASTEGAIEALNLSSGSSSPQATDAKRSGKFTTQAVTSKSLTSGKVTIQAVTSKSLTSGKVTTQAVTPKSLTSGKVTTQAVTPKSLTSGKFTTQAVTPKSLTSDKVTTQVVTPKFLTSGNLTTQAVTSKSMTSGNLTTQAVTPKSVTSGKVKTQAITPKSTTSGNLITQAVTPKSMTSGNLTTQAVTSKSLTSGKVTTQAVTPKSLTSGNLTTQAVTPKSMTSGNLTTQAVTSKSLTSGKVTTQAVTPKSLTSGKVKTQAITPKSTTSGNLITQVVTPKSMTSGNLTTQAVTSKSLTSGKVTTQAVTPKSLTSGNLTTQAVTPKSMTSGNLTTQAVTSKSLTSGKVTTQAVTPKSLTSGNLTTQAVTPKSMTSGNLTTQVVTPKSMTSGKVTTQVVTPKSMTSGNLTTQVVTPKSMTSGNLTTQAVTPKSMTSGNLTTQVVTPKSMTSGNLTTQAVTSKSMTSGNLTTQAVKSKSMTSGNLTTQAVTSKSMTSGNLTTQAATPKSVTSGNLTTQAATPKSVTSGNLTTQAATSKSMTSGNLTTQAVTPKSVTSGNLKTQAVTSKSMTSGILTTQDVTPKSLTSGRLTRQDVTPKSVTDHFMSMINNMFTSKSTSTTHTPATTKDSQIKDSMKLNDSSKDFATPKSVTGRITSILGKTFSKRSTTNIPIVTTTGMPTSTVDTTRAQTLFVSRTGMPISAVDTPSSIVTEQHILPTVTGSSVSSTVTSSSVSPSSVTTTKSASTVTSDIFATTFSTSPVSTTATTLSFSTYKTQALTTTSIDTSALSSEAAVADTAASTTHKKTQVADDSQKMTAKIDSTELTSTSTAAPTITTTTKIGISNEVMGADSTSLVNSSELSSTAGLDGQNAVNVTGDASVTNSMPVASNPIDKPDVFDTSANSSRSSVQRSGNMDGSTGGTAKTVNSPQAVITDNVDRQVMSTEGNRHSAQSDSREEDVSNSEPSDSVSLKYCQEEYASVCATEAIDELSLVGHCDRNWYGHRLLDRCYKPVEYLLKAIEARQTCLHFSASLATVDTGFYGNITAMILSYFSPGSKVWVDASLNLDIPGDGQCAALEDGQLHNVDCNSRLPFICQKDAHIYTPYFEDMVDGKNSVTFVQNLTSFHPQILWCPLRMAAFDDVILWFKDGRPIASQDDTSMTSYSYPNGNMPNRLDIDLSILERVGEGGSRIPKPAILQGLYWCEIWRREPFNRVVSQKIFLKFTDVVTLYGHIITEPTNHVTAAIFNRMGHISGLPLVMERRLATINKNITHYMRSVLPIVRDIVTFIKSTNPATGKSEFTTYICVATGDLSSGMRGNLADLYLSAFYQALVVSKDDLRTEWNLTLPIRRAVAVTMADMCPETNLIDKSSGLSATFPSTAVNNVAISRDTCNTVPIGSARCKGDLQTGAYWDSWRVVNSCLDSGQPKGQADKGNNTSVTETGKPGGNKESSNNSGNVVQPGTSSGSTLLELIKIHVDADNVIEVAGRLAGLIDETEDLSASDIEKVAQVFNHIVSIESPPSKISDRLVKTANKVLDAPEMELRKAEQQSSAPSRLLSDLETFGQKVDMGVDPRVRFVTPNVAMELWSLDDPSDVVIGFGATQTVSWSSPLSEPRIQTIKDRVWSEQHLSTFDVAIELPESLVKNTVKYSDSPLRLTMFIYRKTGLFVQDEDTERSRGTVNSAIISASLGGRKISGLEEHVRLVFKPFQVPRNRQKSTHCVFWDTELTDNSKWSVSGCVYNGTINGRDVCLCNHLTNFAILTDFYGDELPISEENEIALTVLTIIGLMLSIIGLAITIITFLVFKKLRQGRAQQTLFNMAIALLCFQTTFLIGVKQTSVMPICLAVSVLLHYFILVSFAWMLIEAVLQYLTFVKVLGTYVSRYTLKTVIPAWGMPLLPVISVLATDYRLYLGRVSYCWMNLQAFYYAFALPVGIIIVFNIVMFVIIIVSIATKPKGLRSNQTNNNKTRTTSLKAAITIFVLLGLTWLFGYLAIEDARLPFQYAFTILSSLQGFLIFLLMVARRRQVREQWDGMCCVKMQGKQNNQKKLSPTFSNSTTCSNSNNSQPSSTNQTYTSDSSILSSSTGSRSQKSLNI